MNAKEVLLNQMKWSYDTPQEGWFPNLTDALEALKFEDAGKSNGDDSHTVWDVINHLIYWNDRNLRRFKDTKATLDSPFQDNEESFKQKELEKTNENWMRTIEQAHQVFSQWIIAVEGATGARLNSQLSDNDTRIASEVIAHMNIHNAYHIGQIVIIRKLHNVWKNKY